MTTPAHPAPPPFDRVRAGRDPASVYAPRVTDAQLDEVETQLTSRLPWSYREFMKRFGPGELMGWVRLTPVSPLRDRGKDALVARTFALRKFFAASRSPTADTARLSRLVYFASSGGGDTYAWDPVAVSGDASHECRCYLLPRAREGEPESAGETFAEFVEWADALIRSWRDDEENEDGTSFSPAYLRAKKPPLRRDVKRWLTWNEGTIAGLARAVRAGHLKTLPVLADALEEAGCTNADVLDSCRRGIREVDVAWVVWLLSREQSLFDGERRR